MGHVVLSFVVPACDEEDSIKNTLETLDAVVMNKKLPYEIVVVNDGSTDKTLANALKYAERNAHVRVVNHVVNVGKGYAVKTGFMQTIGDVVVFVDSGMEINLSTVSRYVDALEHADIVIASKWHPESVVKIPLVRRILGCGFNLLVRVLTGVKLKDTQAGLKAIRRKAFEDVFQRLAVKRYAFDVELLAVAHLYGLKVVEMPVKIKMGASFKLRDIGKMFVDLLGIAYRLRMIHWYQRSIPAKNGLQKFVSLVFREQ